MARNMIAVVIGLLLLAGLGGLLFTFGFVLSAHSALDTPTDMQIRVADMVKNFLVPGDVQSQKNPVTLTADTRTQARRLYTARCVVCHDVDGKGNTATGSHLFPRAADLTAPRTQDKSDGVLYWIVGNGLPHTGMPGWKTILNDTEIWQIVAYMRLLPQGVAAIAEESPTPAPTATPQPPSPTPVPPSPTAVPAATATTAATTAPAATPIPTVVSPTGVAPTQVPTRLPATPAATTAPASPTVPATAAGSSTAAPTLTIAAPAPTAAVIQATNTMTVSIEDYSYLPDKLTVTAGTRVVWFNKDDDEHSVTADDNKTFDSGEFGTGKSFAHIFDKPGTYTYYCVPHDYMHGTIIVQ